MMLKKFISAHLLGHLFYGLIASASDVQPNVSSEEQTKQGNLTSENAILRGNERSICEQCIFNRECADLKFFGTDLDGTFVARNPVSMARNLDTLGKALAKGHNVFFCTGRGLDESMRLVPQELLDIGFHGYPGVYHNGAVVYGPDGTILRASNFPKNILKRFVDTVIARNHENFTIFISMTKWYVISDDMPFINALRKEMGIASTVNCSTVDDLMEETIVKLMVIDYEKIKNDLSDIEGVEFISKSAVPRFTDLTAPGITKGSGLELLLKEMGASFADCGYIGDAENDLEAMGLVEHSFAVGNAKHTVKQAARHVLRETNEECAFSVVLHTVYDL